ncbi:hypothetical protein GOBAR_DD27730 [Gossypium barbadense]|nr:hypothetical protein GOBAR_DD27730 [Gossypium barbadense]
MAQSSARSFISNVDWLNLLANVARDSSSHCLNTNKLYFDFKAVLLAMTRKDFDQLIKFIRGALDLHVTSELEEVIGGVLSPIEPRLRKFKIAPI